MANCLGKEKDNGDTKKMKHPDPKLHLYISLAKSVIRIIAGGALVLGDIMVAGALLILAEVLGIGEELV